MNSNADKRRVPDRPANPESLGRLGDPIARFEIYMRRCLNADGVIEGPLPAFAKDTEALSSLYEAMVLARTFDEKAVALQRTGRLGTYASSLGQEAVGIGVVDAMRVEDVLLPSFREHGAQLCRGVTPTELLLFWGGDERGSDFSGSLGDFPVSIPVASQFPHAAGVALAFQTRNEQRVAVAFGGDGSTSKGDFYEALNVCGAWKLPAVFIISNNQWAISVPRQAQTGAETLAQKAIAAGVQGEQVDGNDVIAMRHASEIALQRARAGEGATLIEAITYRLGDHTTADDASRYRDDVDVSPHWQREPIARCGPIWWSSVQWAKEREERLLQDARQEGRRRGAGISCRRAAAAGPPCLITCLSAYRRLLRGSEMSQFARGVLMPELTMVEAINAALRDALEQDERVVVFGEDVAIDGGVFRATDGLCQRFGAARCVTRLSLKR